MQMFSFSLKNSVVGFTASEQRKKNTDHISQMISQSKNCWVNLRKKLDVEALMDHITFLNKRPERSYPPMATSIEDIVRGRESSHWTMTCSKSD